MKDFHCCATCKNFLAKRENNRMTYSCVRLGFETKPDYKFNCWDPKEKIVELMKKK
ncbi:hypothetical protein [Neobacillus terrae]|uniref:hypothetical protein n=1 Tax=Neobacillus terrae TaxID=3034837 RepID=UPI00140B536D|nr:hypothetical protein [Neobacillus terrae]NHM32706.1 hypothetical protein [Neobacillus terrae]